MPALQEMYEDAIASGLSAKLLNYEELSAKEPNVIGHAGIFIPEAGVVNPYEMNIAVYNTAILSGCTGLDQCKVISI